MKFPPSLILCMALIAGIILGEHMALPNGVLSYVTSISAVSACVALAALFLSALLRRYGRVATAFIIVAVFSLGVFLIKSERNTYTVPFEDSIVSFMNEKREELIDTYRQCGLEDDEYAVVTAMTLGERTHVSSDLKETYNVSGASHVFALSGMHLGIIYALLAMLLPWRMTAHLGRMRRLAQFLLAMLMVFTLWAYVMLVGAHPSIMRAAVMLTVYTMARRLSRRPDGLSVLVFTLMLLLVIWPEWLFDVGFQMSFMAVTSITLLYVPVNRWLTERMPYGWKYAVPRLLLRTMLISTCAQIGVAPLIALYFHRFSTYFLLTNLPVPLLAALIIYLAILLLVCAALPFTSLTAIVAWALQHVTAYLNRYLAWIASLPQASFDDIYINKVQTIIIYVITICVCMIIYRLHHGLRRRLGTVYR